MGIEVVLYISVVTLLTLLLYGLDKLIQARLERNDAVRDRDHLRMVNQCLQTQRDILLDRLHLEQDSSPLTLETPGSLTIEELIQEEPN